MKDLQVKINRKEDRPVYVVVNSINSGEIGLQSDCTITKKGVYLKHPK